MTGNTSAVAGYIPVYKYTKIQRPQFQRNDIFSIIAENKSQDSFAYSESLQHPTIAILLIQILLFSRLLSSVHLLQSNQCFQAIEFVDRHVSEKL